MILTVEQASKDYFRGTISKSKLYDLVRQKEIPVVRISSRKIYFDSDKLDEWIKKLDSGTTVVENEEYGKLRAIKP